MDTDFGDNGLVVSSPGQLTIKMFDLTGKHLKTFRDEASLPKGEHTISFDLEGIDAGLYLLELKAGSCSRKLKLIKQWVSPGKETYAGDSFSACREPALLRPVPEGFVHQVSLSELPGLL
ncbi:MAG: T9SS type A sorting domain-containing protein [Bacteroidales bacterium]|nr:T9SS type A sorting domain-containing protein [Bacteroidales bacterium]